MGLANLLEVKESGKNTEKFLKNYTNRLISLYDQKGLPPGMAVTLASNLNLFGENMHAKFFGNLDYSQGFEVPEDPLLFQEFFSRIDKNSRYVRIQKPTRAKIDEFTLQYNFIRGLRPKRDARREDVKLDERLDPEKFNYAKSDCEPEVFSRQSNKQGSNDLLYNRYPFAPYHFLWVPDRKNLHNQFLDSKKDSGIIERAVKFVSDNGLGSVRLSYNSLGAHASVNHLHLQGFFLTNKWEPPIEDYIKNNKIESEDFYFRGARWIPAKDMERGLKESIKEMNDRYYKGEKISYCFYLTPRGAVFFPRKHQADKDYFENLKRARFTTGFAFFEMLGEIICPNKELSIFDDREKVAEQIRELYNTLSLHK